MDWKKRLWSEWTIIDKIGEGAYGKVYKIKRQDIGGTYYAALKVISFPNDEEKKRFYSKSKCERQSLTHYYQQCIKDLSQEFILLEKLKGHTNIVAYEDHKIISYADGISYDILIRMELLEPLPKYLSTHICNEKLAIKLGIDICEALMLCESEGIVHCDIKPANIFVSEHGNFKVGDFSIAHIVEKMNNNGPVLGTYYYIAPEVARGEGFNRTIDTYALGLILFRILNGGRSPFLSLPPNTLRESDMKDANRKRLNGYELNKPAYASFFMSNVILKACSYEVVKRYSSAYKMKKALERCAFMHKPREISKNISGYLIGLEDSQKSSKDEIRNYNGEYSEKNDYGIIESIKINVEGANSNIDEKKKMEDYFKPAGEI